MYAGNTITQSGKRLWLGTAPIEVDDTVRRHRLLTAGVWILCFAALLVGRLLLPFVQTDAMATHSAITDSLLHGQNWGRQALVGSIEFPPLPTVCLLLATQVGRLIRTPADHLLVAFAQAWALCYVIRMPRRRTARWIGIALMGLMLFIPGIQQAFLACDPNWMTVVPVCSAVHHAFRWYRYRSLRDAVVCAACCGLLTFAGPAGIVTGLALILTMHADLRRLTGVPARDRGGIAFLIWSPFCYGLILLLLVNWLIMGNLLFGLERVLGALRSSDPDSLTRDALAALRQIHPVAAGGLVSLLMCLGSKRGAASSAFSLIAAVVALAFCRAVCEAASVFVPAGELLALACGTLALFLPLFLLEWRWRQWRLPASLLVLAGTAALSTNTRAPRYGSSGEYMTPCPSREYMTRWIDQLWPDSRIAVYGIRVPALYPDVAEKRFLPRVDFHQGLYVQQAHDEQLHLLVAPCDGRFYPRQTGTMADLHANGRPWLLLEKAWPGGWQLWRCVIPPEEESKLGSLASPQREARE